MWLASVDRIAFQTIDLRAFDLGVPVRAFDQSYHQATTTGTGQGDQMVNQWQSTLLVGLHRHRQPIPSRQCGFEGQAIQQVLG